MWLPTSENAVIAGFAETPDNMRGVATIETLDKLATNALSLRLGDEQFAREIYADVRDQAIRSSVRWSDVDIDVRLSVVGDRSSGGVPPGTAAVPLFEVVVTWNYALVPSARVHKFACVSSRDFITPGTDALRLAHPGGPWAQLGDVTPDGATLTMDGDDIEVAPAMRPAVARLRTSRRVAGCLDHDLMWGLFDHTPGIRPRTRRQNG